MVRVRFLLTLFSTLLIIAGCEKGFDYEPCVEPDEYALVDTLNIWTTNPDNPFKNNYVHTNLGNFQSFGGDRESFIYNDRYSSYQFKISERPDSKSPYLDIYMYVNDTLNYILLDFRDDFNKIYYDSYFDTIDLVITKLDSSFISGSFSGEVTLSRYSKPDTGLPKKRSINGDFKIHFVQSDQFVDYVLYEFYPYKNTSYNIYPGFKFSKDLRPFSTNSYEINFYSSIDSTTFHYESYFYGVENAYFDLYFMIPSNISSFLIGGDNLRDYNTTAFRFSFGGPSNGYFNVRNGFIKGYRCPRGWRVDMNLIIAFDKDPNFIVVFTLNQFEEFKEAIPDSN